MVFPNFFITFVRHSFHTSHPSTSPLSRETASPCHQTPHSPHGTRHASRAMHTCCTSQKAMLTRHASSSLTAHPPHTTTLAKGYAHAPRTRHASSSLTAHTPPHYNPRKGLCHTRCSPSHHTRPPHYPPPQRAMPRTRPTRKNAATLSLAAPSFLRRKSEPPQPKYYILQYYM